MRSELLVAHEKLEQFPLLTVCCAHVGWGKKCLLTPEIAPFFCVRPIQEKMFQQLDLLPPSGEGGYTYSVGSLRKS
jgi:hypothetical protein